MSDDDPRAFYLRGALIIVGSTLVLTAAFVGLLAFFSGRLTDIGSRIPWYVLASAVVFAATMLLLERHETSGSIIMITAVVIALLGFPLAMFATEGVIYTVAHPNLVFVEALLLYFIAAGLFGTGLAYWGINHWREFTSTAPPES